MRPTNRPRPLRRTATTAVAILATIAFAACAGDGPTAPATPTPPDPVVPPPAPAPNPTGPLLVTVSGLPAGTPAAVTISSVAGVTRSATATASFADLPAGRYTITAAIARGPQGAFAATPAVQEVDLIAGGAPTLVTVAYAAMPVVVDVPVSGLPAGVPASVTVTPPASPAVAVATTTRFGPGNAGLWRVAALPVATGGHSYAPNPASRDSVVAAGDTVALPVHYEIATGAIAIAVTGLPGGTAGAVSVAGPNGFTSTVSITTTLTDLAPGSYTVTAAPVTAGGITWLPTPASQQVTVAASLVAAPAAIAYVAQLGQLAVTVGGLPDAAEPPTFTLTGGSAPRTLTGAGTIEALVPGAYQLTAPPVTVGGVTWAPATATTPVTITAFATTTVTATYTAQVGNVSIATTGLPGGATPTFTLAGPAGATASLTGAGTVTGLAVGAWTVTAAPVVAGGVTYTPVTATTATAVTLGTTASVTVAYTAQLGQLSLTVAGLPGGVAGAVTVSGPGGFTQLATASIVIANLVPGSYTLTAIAVTQGATTWQPTPASQQVTVAVGGTATATVAYAAQLGSLAITASGLPGGVTPTWTVTGPGGFSQPVSGAQTLSSLATGSYTVAAATITSGPTTYTPTPASRVVSVVAGATATADFAYTGSTGATLNLRIESAYVTQAVQRTDGTVPVVTGRDALVRVFVVANQANSAQPSVRVRIYDGATLLQTTTITAPSSSVPQAMSEGTLASSWNTVVPAANVRAGLRLLADVDPANGIAEADEADNQWPANGTPHVVPTATAPAFTVRFVPVTVGALTGNVVEGNRDNFLITTRRIFPLATVNSEVRAPFTSAATELQSGDGNGNWLTVLQEMNALRAADGAPATMHYYGVVKVSYSSGIAGYGYVPGRAAIGWDYLPSGDRVAAHEWGHNFSRPHTPCGVSGDASYPHAGGVIGAWGWNAATNALVSPTATDIMGYCSNQWISDWTWNRVLQYRATSGMVAEAARGTAHGTSNGGSAGTGDGLLVWGRVVDGRITLEPAIRVDAPATPLPTQPTHRLELLGIAGDALLTVPLAPERVDHVTTHDERHFAVVVPWSATLARHLARLRVRDARSPLGPSAALASATVVARGGVTTADAVPMPDPQVAVTTEGARARITWNARDYPMAVARDAATGAIMGFLRTPGQAVVTGGRQVVVTVTDGVRGMN